MMNREIKGFTLIELMTAVSIFTIIMFISLGSITGVFDANRKSRSLKAVMNNLNLAMEVMSKEMRFGSNYHCGEGVMYEPANCPSGGTIMSFLSSEGEQITYRLAGTTLEKQVDGGDFVAVTAPELTLDSLTFYTLGAGTDNTIQPKVIIKAQGHAGNEKGRSDFTLQTLVSQRMVDTDEVTAYVYPTPDPGYTTPATFWDLTVSKAGSGTVTGPGIACGTTCEWSYTNNSNVTLTPVPSSGSNFSGWSGACSGTGNCNLIMNANKAVTATFSAPTLNWTGTTSGTLPLSAGALKYFTAGSYNITVTASAPFSFQGAAGGATGASGGACPATTIPGYGGSGGGGGAVTRGTTVTLEPLKTYTLTVGAAAGVTTLRNSTDNITLVNLNPGSGASGGTLTVGSNGITGGGGGNQTNGTYQGCYPGGTGGSSANGTGGGGGGETGGGNCVNNPGGTGYGGNGNTSGAAPGLHSSGFGAGQQCEYIGWIDTTMCSGRGGGGGGGATFTSVPGSYGGGGAGGGGQSFEMTYDFCAAGPTSGNIGGAGVGVLYYQGL
jgi:prepilin-type N-terminal cleavage/methylation domain-containing protein